MAKHTKPALPFFTTERHTWGHLFVKKTDIGMKYYFIRMNSHEEIEVAWGIFGYENANFTVQKKNAENLIQARLDHNYKQISTHNLQYYLERYHYKKIPVGECTPVKFIATSANARKSFVARINA